MHASFVVIGGGLSGLAAAIRLARFNDNVLLLERHGRVGGLNSYYFRNNRLFETGLHAITNYAEPSEKHAPLNKLLRQLKIKREELGFRQQHGSVIHFPECSVRFSNDFELLQDEIAAKFGGEIDHFSDLVRHLDSRDPFRPDRFQPTKPVLRSYIGDPLLVDMLLCPICYYGSSWEDDIDFNQFTILFRSIFQEGLFRPGGTIKDVLDLLVRRLETYGGTIRLNTGVAKIITDGNRAVGLELDTGEEISCDHVISTIGIDETRLLLGRTVGTAVNRLAFTESIFHLADSSRSYLPQDTTCVFYNLAPRFRFAEPKTPVDFDSGAITLSHNFDATDPGTHFTEIRTTHLANYSIWSDSAQRAETYESLKAQCVDRSRRRAEDLIGPFARDIVYIDSFTPLTVERFTGKHKGAVYGSPEKHGDGLIGYENLVIAGTDQGYLGIVGSMMSGVAMVNRHILTKM